MCIGHPLIHPLIHPSIHPSFVEQWGHLLLPSYFYRYKKGQSSPLLEFTEDLLKSGSVCDVGKNGMGMERHNKAGREWGSEDVSRPMKDETRGRGQYKEPPFNNTTMLPWVFAASFPVVLTG